MNESSSFIIDVKHAAAHAAEDSSAAATAAEDSSDAVAHAAAHAAEDSSAAATAAEDSSDAAADAAAHSAAHAAAHAAEDSAAAADAATAGIACMGSSIDSSIESLSGIVAIESLSSSIKSITIEDDAALQCLHNDFSVS